MTYRAGIAHMEDLPIAKIVESFRNISNFHISEKIDGSNLIIGIDEDGFYTSRESKGDAKRYRSESDYPLQFSTTYMRGAHLAFEQLLKKRCISNCFKVGDCIEVEILYGHLPNVVEYRGGGNKIVILRTISGSPDTETLLETGETQEIVDLMRPLTANGVGIYVSSDQELWEVVGVRSYDSDMLRSDQIFQMTRHLDVAEMYLSQPSGIDTMSNGELIITPLNRKPMGIQEDWVTLKPKLKAAKESAIQLLRDTFVIPLKELMLDGLVRQCRSQFGAARHDGGWIEGLVFRNIFTQEQFKIIDKDMFMVVKDFAWQYREYLTKKPSSVGNCTSFLGNMQIKLGSIIGYPELGTSQARRAIKNGKIDVSWVNTDNAKDAWLKQLDKTTANLDHELHVYHDRRHYMSLSFNNGEYMSEISYRGEIHNRTLQTFAVVRKKILEMDIKVRQANSANDLVEILVPRRDNETG